MTIYQRKGVWYLDYSFNGKRRRKRVGKSKKLAELALKDIEVKLVKGEFLGITETPDMLFDNLCAQYLEYSKANKTPFSYKRDLTSARKLLVHFKGRMISTITALDLDKYKNARRQEVKPASVNRELSLIKHMFNKAVAWDNLSSNPLQKVAKFKEPPGRVRYLSDEEMKKLLDCCNGHVKSIVIMALNTGMRRGEILNLKWGDVDMKNRVIIVWQTKNNEMRQIPINETLYDELRMIGKQLNEQYVFCNDNGKPFLDVKTGFKAALKRANVRNFRFHDLRHTFASRLVIAGVDIRTVQVLLGHKDIKMTMRYSHLSDAHLKEAVRKLENGTNPSQGIRDNEQNVKKC
jgi:integrase